MQLASHQYYLLEAERYRSLGNKAEAIEYYDRAIAEARNNNCDREEAAASEQAAQFYLEWGKTEIARTYLLEADSAWARSDENLQREALQQRYPQLLAPRQHPQEPTSDLEHTSVENAQLAQANKALEKRARTSKSYLEDCSIQLRKERRARQQAEQQRDRLFSISADLLCIAGFDGCFKKVNPVFAQSLGYSIEELLEQPFINFVHPDDREATLAAALQLTQGENVRGFENRYLCKDGSDKWLSWVAVASVEEGLIYTTVRDISDRKQIEAALRESENRYSILAKASPVGIFYTDAAGNCLEVNDKWRAISGVAPEKALGNGWQQALHPDDRDRVAAQWQQSVREQSPFECELRLQRPDGTTVWVWVQAVADLGNEGKILGYIGTLSDISDRKTAEELLYHSEQRYRSLVQAASQLIWTADARGRTAVDLPEWRAYTGQSVAEVMEYGWLQAVHPDDRGPAHRAWEKAVRDRTPYQQVFRVRSHNGNYRYFISRGVPLLDADGSVREWIGTCSDVHDRKLAELALRRKAEREQFLNRIISRIRSSFEFDKILNAAVQEVRSFLQIDRCNFGFYESEAEEPFWEVTTEARAPELPERTGCYWASDCELLIAPLLGLETLRVDDANRVEDAGSREFLQSLGYQSVLIVPAQTRAGRIIAISCARSQAVQPWSDDEVELLEAVMVQLTIALNQAELYTQSLSKTQALEQTLNQLQKAQSQLIQSEKMSSLGQLVAGVAHEINNPVSFIYGNIAPATEYTSDLLRLVQFYQEEYPQPTPAIADFREEIDIDFIRLDLPKLLDSMKIGAERIREIIQSLRAFSRLDEAEVKQVNLHEGLDGTLMILQNRLKAQPNRPEIQIIKDYGTLPLIECYAGQLNQVFMNILVNAIDALDDLWNSQSYRGRADNLAIRIQTALDKDLTAQSERIIVQISDSGWGMEETVRQRIFDPFFTTKSVGKGTGLGLSISYQIVTEKHGGSLSCHSELGQGTEFVIEIPTLFKNEGSFERL
ncbi:MAG: PAS domain S-box protein [Cyanobacteriota bacterium]|nr:PAS domain S-box protein [Cyanobacteriota bacterium]